MIVCRCNCQKVINFLVDRHKLLFVAMVAEWKARVSYLIDEIHKEKKTFFNILAFFSKGGQQAI